MAKNKRFPQLGKLSLAIIEHFAEAVIGSEAKDQIKDPANQKALLESLNEALTHTEDRFINEHNHKELCDAIRDLPLENLPSLREAIHSFYNRPTDTTFKKILTKQLAQDYPSLASKKVDAAVIKYLEILIEEISIKEDDFREIIGNLSEQRTVKEITRVGGHARRNKR